MPNETTVFRLIWLAISLVWMTFEWRLSRKSQGQREIIQSLENKSEKSLWLTMTVAILLALYFKTQQWLPIPLTYVNRQLTGFIIFGSGIFLRYSAVRHLGRLFSTRLRVLTEHEVVSSGPYRRIRHPSYTGLLMALAGMGVAMGDFLALIVICAPVFAALDRRIENEEKLMLEQTNDGYRKYCEHTWKLIPWVY